MTGSYIEISARDEGRFAAYLATPPKGSGPGLVLLQEIFGINDYMRAMADRFAEEGYVVLVPDLFWRIEPRIELGYEDADVARAMELYQRFDTDAAARDIAATVDALRGLAQHAGKVGALGYCLGGKMAYLAAARTDVDCAVSYYGVGVHEHLDEAANVRCPVVFHFAELDGYCPAEARAAIREAFAGRGDVECYLYPGCDHAFATYGREHFDKPATMMAYSRSLALLRTVMGPHHDLSALWEEHCEHEFGNRDVHRTMATMVAEPYVNHVPTLTGGVGHRELSRFYKWHFIDANPADTRLIPVSRTVGADRVVDELLFCFTHDREIDWMLPGIPPTGKYVEIPLVAVVNFRGDKLYHEHIYWDQASVLVQIGVLDPAGLPVAGVATARKLLDESLPSNELMRNWATSADKPV
jgi:carboxymethylenebutenolidase